MWAFAIVDIPGGWALCDGNNGTPNLLNKTIVAAGGVYAPNDLDGSATHTHTLTIPPHTHGTGFGFPTETRNEMPDGHITAIPIPGDADAGSSLSPVYALSFIMKL